MATKNGLRPATTNDMTAGAQLLMVIGRGGGRQQRMSITIDGGLVTLNGRQCVYYRAGRLEGVVPINSNNLFVRAQNG